MIRPPVVAILGHVDHGKTTLLDYIRNSKLTGAEYGGITQRIGAYEIDTEIEGYENSKITFIDTPGHEAFSLLRARGANVADIAILVIDAKDSLKPQTIESIAHIKSAKIPYIVALNKIDLPDVRLEKVEKDLLKEEVITEKNGGNILALPISAKTGNGVPDLLESILIISSDLKLSYEKTNDIQAYIIETNKDRRGVIASVIIKDGTIQQGDSVYAGETEIKVRSLINDLGKSVKQVLPSTPFELLGFSEIPDVGICLTSQPVQKDTHQGAISKARTAVSIEDIVKSDESVADLPVVIKTDSQGSLDAILHSLKQNDTISLIHTGVSAINQSDVFLAKTTKAILIGFSVKADPQAKQLAKQEKVIIKLYNVIYELLDELQEVSNLIAEREETAKTVKATAKVVATFIVDGQTVYGCKVTKGKVDMGDKAQHIRNDEKIGESKLSSLRIRAKTVSTVKKDQDCGMFFEPPLDIKEGDVLKFTL